MSGILLHGKGFDNEVYRGADGREHTELEPIDGDFFSLTDRTWKAIMQDCMACGIPIDHWPVYEDAIDVALDDVYRKNDLLRSRLVELPEDVVRSNEWLQRIVLCVTQGEMIAYCTK